VNYIAGNMDNMGDQQKKLVINLLAYAAQRDLSPEMLCKLSGITPDELSDDKKRLNPKQVADVWLNAIHLSKDNCFGLHFGESLQLAALDIVGDIIKTSRTVSEALDIAVSIVPLITDAFRLAVIRDSETFSINFISSTDGWESIPHYVQILDLLMAFTIHEMDGLLLKKISPKAIRYPLPVADINEYERVMRCKPDTGANDCSIIFDNSYLAEPIITANYELQKILISKVSADDKYVIGKQTLGARIHAYLLKHSYLGMASLEDIASNFNLSTRTIQRKLKEEDINFQQIVDKVRMDLAINYLKAGDVPVKQICFLLGYNEISSFNRTFKRWTGVTPGSYLKSDAAQFN
jgi:AraC-like DNA-binding protein